ncbi:MAG: succinylglutamate desuccinylase/aspartoacylase family protein [bacterium]
MAIQRISKCITGDSPGKSITLNGFRIGPENAGKKVYLQGALHSDEQPGIMALHHLLPLLFEADKKESLRAEFVVFPMVNPLGMENIEFGMHQGRYDVPSGINFNRGWPDLFAAVEHDIENRLGESEEENKTLIHNTILNWFDTQTATTARDQLRLFVLREAVTADYIFDLHCDDLALVHIFTAPHCETEMQRLGAWMGAAAVLTADDSGGGSFDESVPLLWIKAKRKYPLLPIPLPVAACTLELRGKADVNHRFGFQDAHGLFGYFHSRGLINDEPVGTPGEAVPPKPLTATEILRVTRAGLLAYRVELGETVEKGQAIADLIDLEGEGAFIDKTPVTAGTDGLVISLNSSKYVWPGCSIAKIVGDTPLKSRGDYLLED